MNDSNDKILIMIKNFAYSDKSENSPVYQE